MGDEDKMNNPMKIFSEKGGVEPPLKRKKQFPAGMNDLSSLRQSDITSIAPDGLNRARIYSGRTPEPMADNSDKETPK